jgi:hypothetical protein
VFGQHVDGQFDGGKAGEQDGDAAGVLPAHRVQDLQAILVGIVALAQRQIHNGQAMWRRAQVTERRRQVGGDVHRQPGVAEDLAENLLPGGIVFDDEGARAAHSVSSAMGNRMRKVVPWTPSLSTAMAPPSRTTRVLTHHRPNPSWEAVLSPGGWARCTFVPFLNSKMCWCCAGGIPGPSSLTVISTWRPVVLPAR